MEVEYLSLVITGIVAFVSVTSLLLRGLFRMNAVSVQLDHLSRKTDDMNERMDQVQDRLSRMEKSIVRLEASQENLVRELKSHNHRLNRLEG